MTFKNLLQGVGLSILLGMYIVAISYAVEILNPALLNAVVFSIITIILLPVIKIFEGNANSLVLLSLIEALCFYFSLNLALWLGIELEEVTILLQIYIPTTIAMSIFWLNEQLSLKAILGTLLASTGILLIAVDATLSKFGLLPVMLVLAAGISFTLNNFLIKKIGDFDPLSLIGYKSLFIALISWIITLTIELPDLEILFNLPLKYISIIALMIILNILINYNWYLFIQRFQLSIAINLLMLLPIFSLIMMNYLFEKNFTIEFIWGALLIIIGITIIIVSNQFNIKNKN